MASKSTTGDIDVRELLKAGAHFGHRPNHWNPQMKPYIHSKRGGIYILDLIKTAAHLKTAANFLESSAAEGKDILFVGTKRHIQRIVKEAAIKAGMPYITERWYGGILTNFATFSKQIKRLKQLEEQDKTGELGEARSKRETGELREEIERLNTAFGGIKDIDRVPQVMFVADVVTEKTAIREAIRLGIPVVAIVDTNGDPTNIDYVIPANDDAVSAVELVCNVVADAVAAGVAARKAAKPVEEKTENEPKVKAATKKET